jgi:translocation and assembly module TamB
VHLAGGRVAIVDFGEWTDLALDAKVTDDAAEVTKLEARRGQGRLAASGALRGLAGPQARLTAKVSATSLPLTSSGMPLATVSVEANATGTYGAGSLDVDLNVPHGLVLLPNKQPRALQPLEARSDVLVGRHAVRKAKEPAPPAPARKERALAIRVHAVAPGDLQVKSDTPRVDVELKADVHYEREGSETYLAGTVETVRGSVEPLAGRNFVVQRGVVQFTGGPPSAALLDVSARYANPIAAVTVNVVGTVNKPEVKLSSEPPLEESQIALLIAIGRTDPKPGAANVGASPGGEAGLAALSAVATQGFRNLVQNRLPVDTVSLQPGALRAGKYVTDRIYVGYVLRWEPDPTKSQNPDEVQVEYQITPRWIFESRYGNAQNGGASLVWSKDY